VCSLSFLGIRRHQRPFQASGGFPELPIVTKSIEKDCPAAKRVGFAGVQTMIIKQPLTAARKLIVVFMRSPQSVTGS
jgi:hypothetical protein